MNDHTVIGIDLAKTVFQVSVMSNGKITSNKQVRRSALKALIANHNPAIVAMEACYSSHYWAREFERFGHTVKLIPAQHVKSFKAELHSALDELQRTSEHIAKIEAKLRTYLEHNEECQILHSIPGVGVLNATALVCKYGHGAQFSNARSLPVSLGLTPKTSASGLRLQMQGISKRGDPYLRKQLIHGARALLIFCDKRPDDALCRWASRLKKRRGINIAAVALANRLARLAWVLLQKRQLYRAMPV